MSSSWDSAAKGTDREDITRVGRKYRVLVEDLACKALAEANTGPPPESEAALSQVLADEIASTLSNLNPEFSDRDIISVIEDTFAIACMKYRLGKITDGDGDPPRMEFYERMSSRDVVVTHPEETVQYSREDSMIQTATDILLDNDSEASMIPEVIKNRAYDGWTTLENKAHQWGRDFGLSGTEAVEELIPALIAVEIHTGGNPAHTGAYRAHLFEEAVGVAEGYSEAEGLSDGELQSVDDLLGGHLMSEDDEQPGE